MGMVYFKACPRCEGDVILNSDMYGWYRECIQCGYETDAEDAPEPASTLYSLEEGVAV